MSKKNQKKTNTKVDPNDPWIPFKSGLRIILIVTLALAAWITWQGIPNVGFWRAALWGLGFAGSIWAIFFLMYLFNRFVRRGK